MILKYGTCYSPRRMASSASTGDLLDISRRRSSAASHSSVSPSISRPLMSAVTCEYRACTDPSSWPMRSFLSLTGVSDSSMRVLWVCRSPCGVSRGAIGSQAESARPCAFRPRAGTPGHGSASTGTGCAGLWSLRGYHPVAAGRNSQVANPFRRQCGASCPPAGVPRTYPRSAAACSTFARVPLGTVSGRLRTLETVPVDTLARLATSANRGPADRMAPLAGR